MEERQDPLIYIEADEEITEVIERLKSFPASAVRLVVPKGALILQSLVSLKLLASVARQIPLEVALVTQDEVGQHVAKQAGLTLFARPKDAKPVYRPESLSRRSIEAPLQPMTAESSWESEVESLPHDLPVHHYRHESSVPAQDEPPHGRDLGHATRPIRSRGNFGRRFLMSVLVAGFGLAGWLIFLELAPRATLTVFVNASAVQEELTVLADTSLTDIEEDPAKIPAIRVEAEVSADETTSATGKKEVGELATLTLPLFNYWDANPQTIATGTTFVTADGTEFLSTSDAIIPGATTTLREGKVSTTPGTATVPIAAKVTGVSANGKSGRFTIPALPQIRQDKIYGESTTPTTGGTSREIIVVALADVETLRATVQKALDDSARTELATKAIGNRLLTDAFAIQILEEELSAQVDQEAETVSLKQKAKVLGLVFSDEDLKQVSVSQLVRHTPTGQVVVYSDRDEILTTTETLKLEEGQLAIATVFSTYRAPELTATHLADQIGGLDLPAARDKLLTDPQIHDVTVVLRPRWLSTLPKHASQISLEVSYLFDDQVVGNDEAI